MSKYLPRILVGAVAGYVMFLLASSVDGPDFLSIAIGVSGAIATAGILIALAGNRRVTVAAGAEKQAALALAPPPGKALLVVARQGFIGKLVGLDLTLDGQTFAQLKSPAFTILEVTPGAHRLATKTGAYPFEAPEGGVVGVVVTLGVGAVTFAPQSDLEALGRKLRGMPMVVASPAQI